MATPETPRLLDSPSDIRAEIDRKLVEDGLSHQCAEEEKLLYVWRLYQHTETDLQRAIENEEKLKIAQTAEMQEVENYVEHIRHLSDEREALIQELETENDQLKQEIEALKQDQNASALRDETAEMLIQQGLEEIANVSTSEQIAFLLVERARLLDELEAEQNRSATVTPMTPSVTPALTEDGRTSEDLQRTLEKERTEFEEELNQSRESIRALRDRMKLEHEEEINALMEENNKLEDEYEELKAKMDQVQRENGKLKEDLQKEKELREKEKEKSDSDSRASTPRHGRPPSPARSPNDIALRNIIQEKTKIEGEVIQLKGLVRNFETENNDLKTEVRSMKEEIEKLQISVNQLQMKNKSLRAELEEAETQIDEAENLADEITKERDDMKLRLGSLEKEVKVLRAEPQKSMALQESISILNREKRGLTGELDTLKREYDEMASEKEELANQKLILSKGEIELTSQLQTIQNEMENYKFSKEEYNEQKAELCKTKSLLDSTTVELENVKSEKDRLNIQNDHLTKENKELLNKNQSYREELHQLRLDGQEYSKQEIIVGHMRDQNQKLSKELSTVKEELQEKEKAEAELNEKIYTLEMEIEEKEAIVADLNGKMNSLGRINTELQEKLKVDIKDLSHQYTTETEELKESHQKEMDDLKMKLQLTLQELSKSKQMLDDERSQCSKVEGKARDLELLLEEVQETNSAYDKKLEEITLLHSQVQDLERLVSEKCDIEDQLDEKKKECSDLEQEIEELESSKLELEDTREELTNEKKVRAKLESTVRDLELILEDQRNDHENIQRQFTDKVQSLENQVRSLQDELFCAREELRQTLEKHEQINLSRMLRLDHRQDLKEAKAARIELQERIDNERQRQVQLQSSQEVSNVTQRIEAQKIENLEKQIESMKVRVSDAQKQLESVTIERNAASKEIKELKDSLRAKEMEILESDSSRQELSKAKRELEHLRLATRHDEEERQKHIDKIHSLEELSKQLELDNRELATKLQETIAQITHVEEQLKRERQRNTDKQYHNNRHVSQIETDLDDANSQIRQLRDDIQKKQTHIMKLEADAIGNAAKYESTIQRLESEISEMKQYHKKELENVTERLETTCKDNKELRNQLREKEQEYQHKVQELNRMKGSADRLESQVNTEIKIRTDLENRNSALDQEITKVQTERNVWSQVRTLMEKNATLEAAKRSLEDELERKSSTSRLAETNFNQATASQEVTMKLLQTRSETAERRDTDAKPYLIKAEKLQHDFDDVSFKLKSVEIQLKQAEELRNDLQDKKEHIAQLRNQLEAEKLQRTLLDQTVAELKHQVSLLKAREQKVVEQNRELQHSMLDMETKLEDMHDRNQTAMELDTNITNSWEDERQHYSEVGKRGMLDQIARLQKEVKDLQYELLTVNERREIQERKYEERKMKTKVKLTRARDYYSKERSHMQDQVRQLNDELRISRSTLRKELDWKEKMDKNYQQILREKREYMTQISDCEEQIREKTRAVSMLQVRTKFMEDENSRLQDRIDTLTQQKQGLDKTLKEYKLGNNRDIHISRALTPESHPHSLTGGTSGIGNSVDSSWANDQDNFVDSYLGYRNTQGPSATINSYLTRNYTPHGHMMNLHVYRGEMGSEGSFERDYDT